MEWQLLRWSSVRRNFIYQDDRDVHGNQLYMSTQRNYYRLDDEIHDMLYDRTLSSQDMNNASDYMHLYKYTSHNYQQLLIQSYNVDDSIGSSSISLVKLYQNAKNMHHIQNK